MGDWKDGKREGTGVLERKVWGKNGDTVWKYEGAFSADMQHGDGVETFKTTKVAFAVGFSFKLGMRTD